MTSEPPFKKYASPRLFEQTLFKRQGGNFQRSFFQNPQGQSENGVLGVWYRRQILNRVCSRSRPRPRFLWRKTPKKDPGIFPPRPMRYPINRSEPVLHVRLQAVAAQSCIAGRAVIVDPEHEVLLLNGNPEARFKGVVPGKA